MSLARTPSRRGAISAAASLIVVVLIVSASAVAIVEIQTSNGKQTSTSTVTVTQSSSQQPAIVAAGGQQVLDQVSMDGYTFAPLSGTGTCDGNVSISAPCLTLSLRNAGEGPVTISEIFFDGSLLTPNNFLANTPITMPVGGRSVVLLANGGSFTSGKGGYTGLPAATAPGSPHTLKVVTANGGQNVFSLTAGSA